MARIRILVLTSRTGGGHDARAEAFAAWCARLHGGDVDVRLERMLEDSSSFNRAGVDFYNTIQKGAPLVHWLFYTFVEGLSFLNRDTVSFGRNYYIRVLREYRPHLVFSVHDCLNRGYFQLARQVLGTGRVRCATYCGEFSGGWGYSRNWIEPTADLYVARTQTALDYALARGIPAARGLVRGTLMLPRQLEPLPGGDRRAFRRDALGIHPDLFTVFLATGANGANNHLALLHELLPLSRRCQAVVICGRDEATHRRLVQWRSAYPGFRCHLQGYSDQVHLLMQASDAVVTRGGTTTCAKALHFSCPIIFDAIGGIMPQERLTWKYFHRGAGCEKLESPGDLSALVRRWLDEPATYASARSSFRRLRPEEDPAQLIDELVALANQAAGVRLERGAGPDPQGTA